MTGSYTVDHGSTTKTSPTHIEVYNPNMKTRAQKNKRTPLCTCLGGAERQRKSIGQVGIVVMICQHFCQTAVL
jgi:hypothetical protein